MCSCYRWLHKKSLFFECEVSFGRRCLLDLRLRGEKKNRALCTPCSGGSRSVPFFGAVKVAWKEAHLFFNM